MFDLLRKTIKSIRNNGIRFTLSMIYFQLFSIEDPRKRPEFLKQFEEGPDPEVILEAILPFYPDAKSYSEEENYERYRSLLPIDCMIEPSPSKKRLNLVVDCLDRDSLEKQYAGAVALATEFASRTGRELRIISRDAAADAIAYYQAMETFGIALPESVTFHTDLERNFKGDCRFKLFLSDDDLFMATSWQTAVAVGKTVLYPKYCFYLSDHDIPPGSDDAEAFATRLPDTPICVIESSIGWDYLAKNHPQLLTHAICMETAGKHSIFSFMEKQETWKK